MIQNKDQIIDKIKENDIKFIKCSSKASNLKGWKYNGNRNKKSYRGVSQ